MNTSLKRVDNLSSNNPLQANLQKQLSELLEIKNLLNFKLPPLAKTIQKDVSSFVTKHYPHQTGKFSLIDMECNLFGTNRTFLQFSNNYKTLFHNLQADIKGVIETLQKFPSTKNLSTFITQGIVDNLIKLNKLMLYREEHCQKMMNQLQQNMLNNKPMHSTNYQQTNLCHKCNSHFEHQHILQTKQMMLLGGEKIYNYYKRSIEPKLVTESDEDQQAQNYVGTLYDRIAKIKRNVKKAVVQGDEMITQENMKFTLDRLQSNLEQRKYDILACLIEMGQFGTQLGKSFTNIDNQKDAKSSPKDAKSLPNNGKPLANNPKANDTKHEQINPLPQLTKLLPKFNYQQFTFDIGKHFCKQIKDIQTQLSNIKHKYSDLLTHQMSKLVTKQTQCNLIKDSYDQQMNKNKKKTQRQLSLLHGRINQLETNNKQLKQRLEENSYLTRKNLATKIDMDKVQIEKIVIEKTMHKLVDQYQTKIKEQQTEINTMKLREISIRNKQSQLMDQSIGDKSQSSAVSIPGNNNSCLITTTKIEQPQIGTIKDKNNLTKHYHPTQDSKQPCKQNKKKISMFLQPIISKLHQRNNHSMSVQMTNSHQVENSLNTQMNNNHKRVSVQLPKQGLNSKHNSNQGITELTIQNYVHSTCQMVQSVQVNAELNEDLNQNHLKEQQQNHFDDTDMNDHRLTLNSLLFSIQIPPNNNHFSSIKMKKSLEQQQNKQLLTNTPISTKQLPALKSKNTPKHKLLKAKSYQDSKLLQNNSNQYQNHILHGKQQTNVQLLKRYASHHSTYIKNDDKLANPIRKPLQDKPNRKVLKTLSLSTLKKQESENGHKSVKLPSLSQYQKGTALIKSTQKLKNVQKQQILQKIAACNKNGSLLTKKKRKRRNFSQQQIGVDSMFDNNMTTSLGNNEIKIKKKKQYIIDYIPKLEEQTVSRCKEQYQKIVDSHIQNLFSIQNNSFPTKNENKKRVAQQTDLSPKQKNNSKTLIIVSKSSTMHESPLMTNRLSNNQISLSTKLYSAMASIKSSNLSLYMFIRSKLQESYKRDEHNEITRGNRIKTNCDNGRDKNDGNIDITGLDKQQGTSHMPLSIQKDSNSRKLKDSSFQAKNRSHFHTVSTNTKQADEQHQIQKDRQKEKHETKQVNQMDQKQLRRIINSIIIRHRNLSCVQQVQTYRKSVEQNKENQYHTTSKLCCKHLAQFYQFLNECKTNK